jgi:hypothetical protein
LTQDSKSKKVRYSIERNPKSDPRQEYRYHWADVIVDTTYMNDVMRAVCVIPGLFTFLEWFKTDHMKKTLYRHAEYATEHTEAYVAQYFWFHIWPRTNNFKAVFKKLRPGKISCTTS